MRCLPPTLILIIDITPSFGNLLAIAVLSRQMGLQQGSAQLLCARAATLRLDIEQRSALTSAFPHYDTLSSIAARPSAMALWRISAQNIVSTQEYAYEKNDQRFAEQNEGDPASARL